MAKRAKNLKTPDKSEEVAGPSTDPATNLLLADMVMRAGSYVMRDVVERTMLRGRYGKNTAREIVANKTLGQTAVSFVLAKVATRSLPGALLVGGGSVAKILFDRSQKRRAAKRQGDQQLLDQADGE